MFIFYIFPMVDVTISAGTTMEEVYITWSGVERKNSAAIFYAVPGFNTVLKISGI